MEFPEMTEHQSDTSILDQLGLEGATIITREEYEALPEHRRTWLYDTSPSRNGRGVYLRLADPPPVAALREIAEKSDGVGADYALPVLSEVWALAAAALAEFDGLPS